MAAERLCRIRRRLTCLEANMSHPQESVRTPPDREVPVKHVHHGRTGAAWAGVVIAMVALLLGAYALVTGPDWTLFWVAAGIAVLSLVVARVMQVRGYGAQ